jgi:hypothetical protein
MRDRTVALIWAAGLCLAAAVYLTGPDRFLEDAFRFADRISDSLALLLWHAGARAFDLLRALAVACFAIFIALSVIAAGRGRPVRWVLAVVTLLFFALVWDEGPQATGHWLAAFLLSAAGALSMTRRLTEVPPRLISPRQEERL